MDGFPKISCTPHTINKNNNNNNNDIWHTRFPPASSPHHPDLLTVSRWPPVIKEFPPVSNLRTCQGCWWNRDSFPPTILSSLSFVALYTFTLIPFTWWPKLFLSVLLFLGKSNVTVLKWRIKKWFGYIYDIRERCKKKEQKN